mgnify:CR=1 FL=1
MMIDVSTICDCGNPLSLNVECAICGSKLILVDNKKTK